MVLENVKPVGAVGAVVSSWTTCEPTPLRLPTLSSAIQRMSVLPSLLTLTLALLPATSVPLVTVSAPLMVGSVPSVV